jgi:phosphatidylserine/phosphatidylglycerophosphate/cardiolipin synthase-like enzyme
MNKTQAILYILCSTALLYARFLFADETNVYFSPNGGCQKAVISEFNKARKNIDVAMYYLTSREIAQGLVNAKERGIEVRLVLDKSQETQSYSKSRYLIKRGFEVKYYTGPGLMHNKFAIIDDKVLITGSFNWTPTADRENEENLLIMTDKELIKKYAKRFKYLWKSGRKGEANPEFVLKFW